MELSPRLHTIAQQVPMGARLVDVGTDHGYLPVWLLLNHQIKSAVAADLREGPLSHARETSRQHGLSESISFRLCDGLADIKADEVDTVVLAGMGGETIAAILKAAPWTRQEKLLILQPMTGAPRLRLWLQDHGYTIIKEVICCEGKKLYSIWIVAGGVMPPLSPAEQWAGANCSVALRLDYLNMLESKAEKALCGHKAAQIPEQAAIAYLEEVLTGLREMKKELESNDHSS